MITDEDEFIEKIAQKIIESDFEAATVWILTSIKPVSFIGGELATFFLAPFLYILEDKGFEFIDFFQKRENIGKLITKIEELSEVKAKKSKSLDRYFIWTDIKELVSRLQSKIRKILFQEV